MNCNNTIIRYLLRLIVVIGFVFLIPSCGSDDENDEPAMISISDINGSWVSKLQNGDIIEFDFNYRPGVSNTFTTKEYSHWQLSLSGYGGWMYVASSNTIALGIDIGTGNVYTVDYRIDKLTPNSLTLTNQRLGNTREYFRVKDEYLLAEGESCTITVHSNWEIICDDNPVIDFSGETVTGLKYGTDLIRVNSGNNSWYIRVTVEPELIKFLNLIHGTTEEVRKKLGTPDKYGIMSDGSGSVFYYDNPTSSIQYAEIYYTQNNIITNIGLKWREKKDYKYTEEYITTHYTKDETMDNVYYDGPTFFTSNVEMFLDSEDNLVEIIDLQYYLSSPSKVRNYRIK